MDSIRRAWSGRAKQDPWSAERALRGQRGDGPGQPSGEHDRRDAGVNDLRAMIPPRHALTSPSRAGRDPGRRAVGEMPSPLLFSWTPAAY